MKIGRAFEKSQPLIYYLIIIFAPTLTIIQSVSMCPAKILGFPNPTGYMFTSFSSLFVCYPHLGKRPRGGL
jgi:hypothetical protein